MKKISAALLLLAMSLPAFAGDELKTVLQGHSGKSVTVRTSGGGEFTGKVVKVGDELLQLGELSGKEFFDASIRIDDIEAVSFRAR